MKSTIAIMFITVWAFASCNCAKKTVDGNTGQNAVQMQKDGFVQGTITFSEDEEICSYTIVTNSDTREFLDPINLDDAYKVDGKKVWIKFNSLRMKNRCEKARPIEITEIQERK